MYLFIYFWLCWVFVAARGLSLVVASGGYSSLQCAGFSLRWLLLLWSTGSRHTGLVAPRHVGSSWTRARTRVPCIGRGILNHCATREVPSKYLLVEGEEKEYFETYLNNSQLVILCLYDKTLKSESWGLGVI